MHSRFPGHHIICEVRLFVVHESNFNLMSFLALSVIHINLPAKVHCLRHRVNCQLIWTVISRIYTGVTCTSWV